MNDLLERSIEIIRNNQSANGAYIACPNFQQYRFCWLRDGSFIAYAMDRAGEHRSAQQFYHWVDAVVKNQSSRVDKLAKKLARGLKPDPHELLPARYRLDGTLEEGTEWPNFQLDGYGTWLWGLARHAEITGDLELFDEFRKSIELTIQYLSLCWPMPTYDCWEESGDRIHPASLACIYGGLTAINHYLNRDDVKKLASDIKEFVMTQGVTGGRFIKSLGNTNVDASLLWLTVPFDLVAPDDPLMKATVAEIERCLYHQGVHRYAADTYYGGGEWLLLAAWLGWYYCRIEQFDKAASIRSWLESCANRDGELPEQMLAHVNEPRFIHEWENRWGAVAVPLLWSHAMYVILDKELSVVYSK